ncbi:MAG: DUF4445 domain-containing protein [Clostridia bacterium]|nr:DUF4445 domain-containing protein [Clostridia bacterium]
MIRIFHASEGVSLMEVMRREGTALNAPCGGNHSCGKCRVKILAGANIPVTEEEKRLLSEEELKEGWRLACSVYGPGEWTVEVPEQDKGARVMTDGGSADGTKLDPASRTACIRIEKPTLEDARADGERLGQYRLSLDEMRKLPRLIRENERLYVYELRRQTKDYCESIVSAEEIGNLGVAVDVGTTTMAAYLIDLQTGEQLGCASEMNPQRSFGGDVISRADYACESVENQRRLQTLVVSAIESMTRRMLKECGRDKKDVRHIYCVGNTIMMHLLAGLETGYITKSPFTPVYKYGFTVRANEMGMGLENAHVSLGTCVAGYVGADTLAAVLACDMLHAHELSLMVDIGTNGEIVLGNEKGMVCCSAAAGPAFEGAHIRCGSGAQDGAIDHVKIGNGEVTFSVLGGGEAKSICGSGLVDAIAEMIESGIIDETGRIDEDFLPEEYEDRLFEFEGNPAFSLDGKNENGVFIAQQDVREVQLAKSAIAAGIQVLMNEMGAEFDQVGKLFLAGGFGNYIDRESAVKIGLLPKELADRIIPVGNAAGTGARRAIKNAAQWEQADEVLPKCMRYVELSARADFQELFVEKMMFGEEEY